jgi:hypothetical protein
MTRISSTKIAGSKVDAFVLSMYLRPGEPVHGVGADFKGQLPAIQHLVKAE